VIAAAWPDGTYAAVLANGHRLRAFVPGRAGQPAPRLSPGEKVTLEVSPCDLSKGRIIVETDRVKL
jgi:translation initiation factor IF-1